MKLRHIIHPSVGHTATRFINDLMGVFGPQASVFAHLPSSEQLHDISYDVMHMQARGVIVTSGRLQADDVWTVYHTAMTLPADQVAQVDEVIDWRSEPDPPPGVAVRALRHVDRIKSDRWLVPVLRSAVRESPDDLMLSGVLDNLSADAEIVLEPHDIPDNIYGEAIAARKDRSGLHIAEDHAVHLPQFLTYAQAVIVTGGEIWPRAAVHAAAAGIPVVMTQRAAKAFKQPPIHKSQCWIVRDGVDAVKTLTRLRENRTAAAELAAGGKLWASKYDVHVHGKAWRERATRKTSQSSK